MHSSFWPNTLYGSSDFSINENEHEKPQGDVLLATTKATLTDYLTINDSNLVAGYPRQVGNEWEALFELDFSSLLLKNEVSIDVEHWENENNVPLNSASIEIDYRTNKITFYCAVQDPQDITDRLQILVPYTATVLYGLDQYVRIDKTLNAIVINWHNQNVLKVCYTEPQFGSVRDVVVFKRPENDLVTTAFYLSLNDTKTDFVMSEKNGILYRRYKAHQNDINRSVDYIYDEEE